ncbi:sensor histidine kinase KdpD [Clostridium intestinale]|uniref:histidine kinase n=2 Tax=Clostridium intestinale TaxID=36845 RepID=A0A7D6VSH7_9CLOT|nr:sensor histidine kinase KdpD [Clostridium intestinale]QLY79817.1 sensor histidine kinase KdpD [Clostridium intestinale]
MMEENNRPDPEILLEEILISENNKKGKLKIFFGYAAGVGKTYAMLDDAQEQIKCGVDVVVGYIEPHARPETMELIEGLPILPCKNIAYKNISLKEFDLDGALKRKPELILVDELAHSNAFGVRNKKRYQDIEELLNAGIDVYTTVNVQHIESLNDVVRDITKVTVQETVPDYFFDQAHKVNLIDIDPEELLERFKDGKIYKADRAKKAMYNFFTKENLRLLREISMRKVADRISNESQSKRSTFEKASNSKFLVCISPSPSSSKCIRWTARAAEAFHAPWIAVYVENTDEDNLNDNQKKNLLSNVRLAEKLGAEVVNLNGYDIAAAITEYAKLSGITNIVIGKSRNKKTLRNLFDMDFEDKLVSFLPNTEVHIIPGNTAGKPCKKSRKKYWDNRLYFSWKDSLLTLGLIIIATFISLALREIDIGDQNIIMVYILFVLIISRITRGYMYGVMASLISVLTFNFFFTVPFYTFNAIQAGYPITFIIMLIVALITSALTVRIKTQASQAVARERRTEVLYEINKRLLVTRGLKNIIELTNDYITKLFSRSVIFYTNDLENKFDYSFAKVSNTDEDTFMITEDEKAVANWVFVNGKRAGAGTDTLMGAGAFYMPVASQNRVLGVIGISCRVGVLSQDNRQFLRMIISQVAMALERQYLSDEQRKILVESEKEKMRSNLLRAIAHDLRTPLTGILGSSSAILESGDVIDENTKEKLLYNIKEDSQWLIRMVENLLSVTRINEGTMNVAKTPEAVEEIVAEAIARIRQRFVGSYIEVKVPDELLLVPMDGTLIVQVLINLLDNAIKHTINNEKIEVIVKKKVNLVLFEVIDNGVGISQEDFPYLFESYIPNGKKSSDSSRGMGIGLSICKSIIKAHGGKIEAANKKTSGAVFRFTLPLE